LLARENGIKIKAPEEQILKQVKQDFTREMKKFKIGPRER
jgi:hypothetical protein